MITVLSAVIDLSCIKIRFIIIIIIILFYLVVLPAFCVLNVIFTIFIFILF